MSTKLFFLFFICLVLSVQAQIGSKEYQTKKITLEKDTIRFDSVPINPIQFKVFNAQLKLIPELHYTVNFNKATLIINAKKYKVITLSYYRFPEFLTKTYSPLNKNIILPNTAKTGKLYSLTTTKKTTPTPLFNGLQTKGFISRGITSGNNQNAVTSAALDLEISGKLSNNVTLKANIWDTNMPIQQNGYSQNITDFDRIFVEMTHKNWRVKAGDLSLTNTESFFAPFVKQAAGLEVEANISKHLTASASGAVVRGKFNRFTIVGTEGNQGPYKILGANNAPNIVIVGGSDKVFINGIKIERGQNKDYSIDYNLGEITFNTTYPITNDMRITIEFQYSDRNYTRFVTYNSIKYNTESFKINSFFFSENDAKNQPIQQNLSETQKEILANAGNNSDLMVSESAFLDTFDETKILYKKITTGTTPYFEYTTENLDSLYFVTFTNLGANNGDYNLERSTAIGNIFKFVGKNNGSFSPITRLVAPTKNQVFVLQSSYNSGKKTTISAEMAISNTDANLFSSLDDANNAATAVKVDWSQILIDKKWQLKSDVSYEFVNKNYAIEQRWEPVEFNRTWNLLTNNATKKFLETQLTLQNKNNNSISYKFSKLDYTNTYSGYMHDFASILQYNNTNITTTASYLKNTSTLENNSFYTAKANITHRFSKSWLGGFTNIENNTRQDIATKQYRQTSHKFKEFETYFGIGDTTKVFAKIGYNFRDNDSIKNNTFTEINNRNTIYLKSKLINTKTTKLSVFANYRQTKNTFTANEKALNSRVNIYKTLFNKFITSNTLFETSSGNLAQQDYIYVKTEPGFGYYTWLDYNEDGIQDFDEFEIAEFQDQANYLRIPKPNLRFIATQKAKINQSLDLNFKQLVANKNNTISKFANNTTISIDNETRKTDASLNINPFNTSSTNLIGLNYNLRNSLYFNRNLQHYSTTYIYGSLRNKQQFFIGAQDNNITLHQLNFSHKFKTFWLLDIMSKHSKNSLSTENFNLRNYTIISTEAKPKLSFLYTKNNRFSFYYHYKNKENTQLDFEVLKQQQFGLEYYKTLGTTTKITADATFFINNFSGNANTPVAYQMLEGLQPGKNYTWSVFFKRRLNSFLNLNLNYLGRRSPNSKTIHTGSVQLRASF